jgi:DHA2 family methylenomycin A resistance protein-like MFS transporter
VNVALPSMRGELGGGITGRPWLVDGYTLTFAALVLSAGSLTDRFRAGRTFGTGVAVVLLASVACGLAPDFPALVTAWFAQGAAAAIVMPSSMALIGEARPNPVQRARAVAVWALGGSFADAAGPLVDGLPTMWSWRLIFFVDLPVGVAVLLLLARAARSPRRKAPLDLVGQLSAVVAMGGLTYGAVEAGAAGFGAPRVLVAVTTAVGALTLFVAVQARSSNPTVPLDMFRSRTVSIAVAVGFAFVIRYYGLPFLMSLYLQQVRRLTSLDTGVVFLPMMLASLVLTPFSARIAERVGPRVSVVSDLLLMTAGMATLAVVADDSRLWLVAALMGLTGLAGPLIMPPVMASLLNSVPSSLAGTASGVFNTSRQLAGALAVAVFGALLTTPAGFMHGLRTGLVTVAVTTLAAAVASLFLAPAAAARALTSRLGRRRRAG